MGCHQTHQPLAAGTLVLCPRLVEGNHVQVSGSLEEHWFPEQLLVALP
ncbi:hypothetical protein [Deinococcus cellulosilyticus]|uniref:Uncharacterized protein n=1 Tax=Deinococcus cellulosilyticus (strain DSM 18568 / NBRC 106333 / KACC 11606 / 5516J-15) TaxID=1223518 RepID=A0A511MZS9_DEIC1|nr:hypothetical protein [Deinococcus cellulosilyticus]GEM45616.1 hypothetical protein DC3_12510 [Deinococcus cellulosilyticus NBRC 106333 = KACC 11606]